MSAHARLPSVDRIIRHAALADVVGRFGLELVKETSRENCSSRSARDAAPPAWATAAEHYRDAVEQRLNERVGPGLRNVFNMTGTIIHTNLGRAQISRAMAQAGVEAADQSGHARIRSRPGPSRRARLGDRTDVVRADRRRSRDRRQQQCGRTAAGAEQPRPRQIGAGLARRAHRNRRQLSAAGHHRALGLQHPRSRHHQSHSSARLRAGDRRNDRAAAQSASRATTESSDSRSNVETPALADACARQRPAARRRSRQRRVGGSRTLRSAARTDGARDACGGRRSRHVQRR